MRLSLLLIFSAVILSEAQVDVHVGVTTAYNATFVLDMGLPDDPRYNSKITYKYSPFGFNECANLLVGMQLGVHYMFTSTMSFKYKGTR